MATLVETLTDVGRRLAAVLREPSVKEPDPNTVSGAVFSFVNQAYTSTAEDRERIQKLRDFFNGDQVRGTGVNDGVYYIPDWPGEDEEDKTVRADRMEELTWNRIRDGVLTHADALYAWGRGRSVHRRIEWGEETEADQADRDWLEDYFSKRVWKKNNYAQWMWGLWATVGAESRALVLHSWLDGSRKRLDKFESGVSRQKMKDNGVVWSEVLDNLQCIAIPHARQPRELGAVVRWYADPDAGNVMGGAIAPAPGQNDTITELVTDSLWFRFRGRELIPHSWGTENRYGDVRTLFSLIRNPADIADSEDGLSMQVMLLEDIYNGAEIKRNHAFPEILYVGYEPPYRIVDGKKTLMRGPTIAHIAPDKGADIKKVGPPANISDIGISQGDIHQALDESMGLSVIERSSEGLGQIRSAPGIGRMQAKSERRRRRKMIHAENSERELFEAIRDMTLYHAFPQEDREAMRDCEIIVQFPDDAFTSDPYTAAQTDQIEVTAGLESRAEKVRARHPEMTEDQVQARVTEIEAEMEKAAQARKPDPSAQGRSLAQEGAKS